MASGKDTGVYLFFTWPYAIKMNLRMVPKLVAYKTIPQNLLAVITHFCTDFKMTLSKNWLYLVVTMYPNQISLTLSNSFSIRSTWLSVLRQSLTRAQRTRFVSGNWNGEMQILRNVWAATPRTQNEMSAIEDTWPSSICAHCRLWNERATNYDYPCLINRPLF